MPDILALKEKRNKTVEEARSIIEAAEAADRDFNEQEQRDFDRAHEEIGSLDRRIDRQEAEEERDLAQAQTPRGPAGNGTGEPEVELADQFRALAAGERRSVTVNFTGAEVRDLVVGTDTAGGHTVPTSFVRRLYEFMTERAAMRRTNVSVITTNSGEPLQIPKVTAHGSAGWVVEGGTLQESDPAFGQVEFGAHKAGQLIQVSSELIDDTAVNLLDFIARDAGYALGELTGAAYLNGSGTTQPTGVLGAVTTGATDPAGAGSEAVTYDLLYTLFFSIIEPYRRNAYWMMNDSTLESIVKIKDADGYSILQRDVTTGFPDRLFGRRVVTDPNMPSVADTNRSVLFGDFSAYYIRDVGQMRFERSTDYAFANDLVTFRSLLRTDGKLVDETGAVKALQH